MTIAAAIEQKRLIQYQKITSKDEGNVFRYND